MLYLCVISAAFVEGSAEETEGRQNSAAGKGVGNTDDNTDNEDGVNDDNDVTEDEDDEELAGDGGRFRRAYARAIFPKCTDVLSPTTHAGSALDAVIAYRNAHPGRKHTIVLVTGHLTPVGTHNYVLQNFSVVRHVRHVHSAETVTIQYSFTPDESLEPDDYNLVLGVYFHDNITNTTHFAAAFNGTVTVDESLRTDPRTFFTYITLLAIIFGAGYFAASKTGLLFALKSARKGSGAASWQRTEVGTDGEAYDPDYINNEHQKYKDCVMRRLTPTTSARKTS